ncbi:MAG TPA: family 10 glycosylhydrolase, partial [Flavisolibacter sp.]|nr:family 10 glycosylhydrolase [Flavisolibacter sp.]
GYDEYTKKMFAQEHAGTVPPSDTKNEEWLQWRADKLSAYIKSLYAKVKKQNPNVTVSWAPSIYPWSKEQYLQDWPAWLAGGYADEILPQCYRYNIQAYETIVKELHAQVTTSQKRKVFPGILTSLGDGYLVKQKMLEEMIQINRRYGFKGECTFYFEGLNKLQPFYGNKKNK